MVLITRLLVVHIAEALQLFGKLRLGAVADSETLFNLLQLLLVAHQLVEGVHRDLAEV